MQGSRSRTQDKGCELPDWNPPSEETRNILQTYRRIAIVGLSPRESRDSHRVARYLVEQGYEIVPVNPAQKEILGRHCFKTLKDIPFPIDIANLFIHPTNVPPVVENAIEIGVPVIWMQLGVVHNESAEKASKAGIQVVMNKCIMREHKKMA